VAEPTSRDNNFGALRLLFASLVVVSHSPELLDGNRSRELLTRLFGTLSFGEVAVDGFFLISGFLITQSYIHGSSVGPYLLKRVARIVPGYLVCFVLCIAVVAPLAGATDILTGHRLVRLAARVIELAQPTAEGAFADLPYPALNGSMWTLGYEFRCYLMVPVLGWLGCYRPTGRLVLAAAVAVLLALDTATLPVGPLPLGVHFDIHFTAFFGVGMLAFLFREHIPLRGRWAAAAGILLIAAMCRWQSATIGYAIFGGYSILWFALAAPVVRLSRSDNKADISYGLYLYAWPVQSLTIRWYRGIDPWLLCGIALTMASVLGYFSWRLVERPCLTLAHGLGRVGRAVRLPPNRKPL